MADLKVGRSRLEGRVVVVTGSTSGIGEEVVHGLALCGARVIMIAITQREGDEARLRLLARCPSSKLEVCPLDLRDASAIEKFGARRDLGPSVAALVYCAGVCGFVNTMVAVNFLAPARLAMAMLPHMAKDGRMVLIGSDSHALGTIDFDDFLLARRSRAIGIPSAWNSNAVISAYACTKLMVVLWVREMARRNPKLLWVVVQPGFVDTPMGEEALQHGSITHRILRLVKRFFAKTAWQGAQTVIHVASHPSLDAMCGKGDALPFANNALWKWQNACVDSAELRAKVWAAASKIL